MIQPTFTLLLEAAALPAVLGLAFLGRWALRSSGLARTGAGPRRMSVREVLALDHRRRLLLIGCGEREVLLLTGGAQDLLVGWLPPAGERS